MIHLTEGNIFESNAQSIVNPVNCVGVMGAGLAAKFKQFFPEMFNDYKRQCDEKLVKPGKMHVWVSLTQDQGQSGQKQYIINFPTKIHWKEPSKMNYITSGVTALIQELQQRNIHSVAIPALGCGLGGLPWEPTRDAIISQFQQKAPEKVVFLYAPKV